MATAASATPEQLAAFGSHLRDLLRTRKVTQAAFGKALADELGQPAKSVQSKVSYWCSGTHEPPRPTVYAMERLLEVAPGLLSRDLGYLPVEAVPATDIVAALRNDPQIVDERTRNVLISGYLAAIDSGTGHR